MDRISSGDGQTKWFVELRAASSGASKRTPRKRPSARPFYRAALAFCHTVYQVYQRVGSVLVRLGGPSGAPAETGWNSHLNTRWRVRRQHSKGRIAATRRNLIAHDFGDDTDCRFCCENDPFHQRQRARRASTHSSTACRSRGIDADNTSMPSFVTSTSSSMRIPMASSRT